MTCKDQLFLKTYYIPPQKMGRQSLLAENVLPQVDM